jgi:hypothetical protein
MFSSKENGVFQHGKQQETTWTHFGFKKQILTYLEPLFDLKNIEIFILLPHAATLLPPLFALK